ncbi:14KDa protein [Beet soil-borne mosaic virus]|uniref:14 kDa protein n=1 Tax=Beet soil-borne mosaic virus TaxID=76343 RepID=O72595_9VIRU|nr:14 kDa protein [Beet soil-borne mosaic virus]AAC18574.1 14KDa protein [Beet soil-borne mosaic virus]AEK48989.1 14 kDa protein [Beet soil-borne mosaic virus]APZ76019.1 14K protein [Beet soil-borne mosaic virus]WIW79802.1 cysteine rich protein [Beet soil-borne mosaic virus]
MEKSNSIGVYVKDPITNDCRLFSVKCGNWCLFTNHVFVTYRGKNDDEKVVKDTCRLHFHVKCVSCSSKVTFKANNRDHLEWLSKGFVRVNRNFSIVGACSKCRGVFDSCAQQDELDNNVV